MEGGEGGLKATAVDRGDGVGGDFIGNEMKLGKIGFQVLCRQI